MSHSVALGTENGKWLLFYSNEALLVADYQEGVAIVVYERTGFKLIRNAMKGAGEMVQRLRALIALLKDLGSISSTHMADHN